MNPNNCLLYFACACTLFIAITGCNNSIDETKLFGKYGIDKTGLPDTTPARRAKAAKTTDWTISLEKDNNFVLQGTGKTEYGYWRIEGKKGKDYTILMSFRNNVIFPRLNGNIIYFNQPSVLLDSIFQYAIFVKLNK